MLVDILAFKDEIHYTLWKQGDSSKIGGHIMLGDNEIKICDDGDNMDRPPCINGDGRRDVKSLYRLNDFVVGSEDIVLGSFNCGRKCLYWYKGKLITVDCGAYISGVYYMPVMLGYRDGIMYSGMRLGNGYSHDYLFIEGNKSYKDSDGVLSIFIEDGVSRLDMVRRLI